MSLLQKHIPPGHLSSPASKSQSPSSRRLFGPTTPLTNVPIFAAEDCIFAFALHATCQRRNDLYIQNDCWSPHTSKCGWVRAKGLFSHCIRRWWHYATYPFKRHMCGFWRWCACVVFGCWNSGKNGGKTIAKQTRIIIIWLHLLRELAWMDSVHILRGWMRCRRCVWCPCHVELL